MAEIAPHPTAEKGTGTGRQLRTLLRAIGPAFILATVVVGPGTLTLNTIAGSSYGYTLLWVPVAATFFMIIYTWMAARISLVTGKTLFQVTREKFGSRVAAIGGIFGYLAVLAFQAGNAAAVGFSANALLGMDARIWATLLCALALGLIYMPSLYGKLELLVKVVVGLMLLTFVGTLMTIGVQPEAAVRGLIPSLPDQDSIFLTIGMTATTFSIAAAVYQGYLMLEKNWGVNDMAKEGLDTIVGIGFLGFISAVILLTSAGAIFVAGGEPVLSAEGMAAQLEPLVGPAAVYLFMAGFFFASFSSLIVNPLIGATLLTDGLDKDSTMDGRPVKVWTTVSMAAGLLVVLIFKAPPVELIRFAQGLAVIAFPLLGFLVMAVAGDRKIMGTHVNKPWMQGAAIIGYIAILAIVVNYIRQIASAF